MRGLFKPSNIGFLFGVIFAIGLLKAQRGRELTEKDRSSFPPLHAVTGQVQQRTTHIVASDSKNSVKNQIQESYEGASNLVSDYSQKLAEIEKKIPTGVGMRGLSSEEVHDTPMAHMEFIHELSEQIEKAESSRILKGQMTAFLENCSKQKGAVISVRAFCLSEWARFESVTLDRFNEWTKGHGFKGPIVRLARLSQ